MDTTGNFFSDILQDIRYAFRILRKTPVITAIALLSLALGIGANTAIFSLIDAVMLRMLPVQNPEQLALIKFRSPASAHLRQSATNPILDQVRDHQDAFSAVIAWSPDPDTFDLADGGEVNNIHGIYASGSYFTTLGVRPAAGRLMTASDDVRNCAGVAVLSYGFWQARYGGALSAIGSTIRGADTEWVRLSVFVIGSVRRTKNSLASVGYGNRLFRSHDPARHVLQCCAEVLFGSINEHHTVRGRVQNLGIR